VLKNFRFPIRFKILATVLFVITAVVSVITFTMANLFHADKSAYIRDLTSANAMNASQEVNMLLESYRERLQVYTRLISDSTLAGGQKNELLQKLLEDFGDFVAITIYQNGIEQGSIYDVKLLKEAGMTKESLQQYRLKNPLSHEQLALTKVLVTNSTINEKFPTLTISCLLSDPNATTRISASAVIKLDRMLNLAQQSKVFETYVLDSHGVLLAHRNVRQVAQHEKVDWIPQQKELLKVAGLIRTLEFRHNDEELIGGFGAVEPGGLLVGVQIPKSAAYLTARGLLNSLIGVSLGLLVGAALLSLFWAVRITRPLDMLSKASKDVGRGDFNVRVKPTSNDEIGELSASFNQMTDELYSRETALHKAQEQLVQSEKMAAFGQLGAGIAHEVKNPLAGILGYAQMSLRKIQEGDPLKNNLLIIEKETKRCAGIIDNLMKFARQEKVSMTETNINSVVEDAMAIVDHQLSLQGIKLEKDLAPSLPNFMGNGNQIQQVLMNLMINAQQAMEGKPGTLRLSTALNDSGQIEVRVSDAGTGMPAEISTKVFEPFFTTKAAGKGTGLGLSVSYGIVKDHKGEIRVESELGLGTTFIITLPVMGFDAQITT